MLEFVYGLLATCEAFFFDAYGEVGLLGDFRLVAGDGW